MKGAAARGWDLGAAQRDLGVGVKGFGARHGSSRGEHGSSASREDGAGGEARSSRSRMNRGTVSVGVSCPCHALGNRAIVVSW